MLSAASKMLLATSPSGSPGMLAVFQTSFCERVIK